MGRSKKTPEPEPEERSAAAGACVLIVLAGVVIAVAFACSPIAGVLGLWVAGAVLLWRSARRVSDSSATPPPREGLPSCRKCAGQELVDGAPSEPQKGMLIYRFALPKRPGHTHIHIEEVEESTL
ncbi:hypothetical protein [Streptomyces sp. NPDC005302]|uniref:hypothetical protein n=1 Tax=Streptomyces sp. NPDC005302 TaxID=3154675 RepID=UPI0033B815A5